MANCPPVTAMLLAACAASTQERSPFNTPQKSVNLDQEFAGVVIQRAEMEQIKRVQNPKIVECFSLDLTATQTAALLQLNRKTVNGLYQRFRLLIAWQRMNQRREFRGVVEVDESYFGPSRVRGCALPRRRGRGTLKQPVFGIFERQGEIYTEIVNDCSQPTWRAIIRGRIDPASVVCPDGWPGYDGLVEVGYDRHVRINKKKSFTKGRAHINGIETFWSSTKCRLAKFNGVKANFHLHLKECE